jgi:hypothetical protein
MHDLLRPTLKRACSLLLLVLPCALPSVAQSDVDLRQLFAANTLDQEGKPPFHVKLEFQLYDLEGKPSEKGTVEEWWASPKLQRIVITAPSLTGVLTDDATALSDQQLREQELIKELLAAELHPIPNYQNFAGFRVGESQQTLDKVSFRCIAVSSIKPQVPVDPEYPMVIPSTYLAVPATDALRRKDANGETVSRNSIGTFHDTNVALDLQIAYASPLKLTVALMSRLAITGHVVAMNSFDPATSKVDLSAPDPNRVTREQIPETFVSGRIITVGGLRYPEVAEHADIGGAVTLHAVISKQGKITQLVVIASTNRVFTEPTKAAVSQRIYTPFLRDGNPVEVDTNILALFQFGRVFSF